MMNAWHIRPELPLNKDLATGPPLFEFLPIKHYNGEKVFCLSFIIGRCNVFFSENSNRLACISQFS
jgi:hypothetical protein